jgi:hypothetical protein
LSQLFRGLTVVTRDAASWNVESLLPTQLPHVKRARGKCWGIPVLGVLQVLSKLLLERFMLVSQRCDRIVRFRFMINQELVEPIQKFLRRCLLSNPARKGLVDNLFHIMGQAVREHTFTLTMGVGRVCVSGMRIWRRLLAHHHNPTPLFASHALKLDSQATVILIVTSAHVMMSVFVVGTACLF